jgi:DNA repair ATPase RecN
VKKVLFAIALLSLLSLTACQPVANARTQACDTMRGVNQQLADTKSAVINSTPVQTVGQVRATINDTKTKINTARTVYSVLNNNGSTMELVRALDQMNAQLEGEPADTPVSQLKDKLSPSVETVSSTSQQLYDAVCAAK